MSDHINSAHSVSVSPRRRLSLYCGCKNNREPEYHCENHNDVICSPCKDEYHHKCKTVPILRKCSCKNSWPIDAILAKSKLLKDKYERLIHKCNTNKKELGLSKDICLNEIEAFRKELNNCLDKLQQKMLKELNDREVEKRKQIDELIATLTNASQMIDVGEDVLDKARTDGRNRMVFIAKVQASKTIRDCESRLADLEKDITDLILTFEKNTQLTDLLADVKSFGAINKIKTDALKN